MQSTGHTRVILRFPLLLSCMRESVHRSQHDAHHDMIGHRRDTTRMHTRAVPHTRQITYIGENARGRRDEHALRILKDGLRRILTEAPPRYGPNTTNRQHNHCNCYCRSSSGGGSGGSGGGWACGPPRCCHCRLRGHHPPCPAEACATASDLRVLARTRGQCANASAVVRRFPSPFRTRPALDDKSRPTD
jgi:hypothetical protein